MNVTILRHEGTRLVNRSAVLLIIFILARSTPLLGQESVSVSNDPLVKAGESISFTVTLDKAPSFEGRIHLYAEGPNPEQALSSEGQVLPNTKIIRIDLPVPATASGGTWHLKAVMFWTGFKWQELKIKDTTFQVIANSGLVYPTSAEVAVNFSQVQLLRKAAVDIQVQIQSLKANFGKPEGDAQVGSVTIIQQNVRQAIESLDATESAFHKLGATAFKTDAAGIFFDDLRVSYKEVESELKKTVTNDHQQELLDL